MVPPCAALAKQGFDRIYRGAILDSETNGQVLGYKAGDQIEYRVGVSIQHRC